MPLPPHPGEGKAPFDLDNPPLVTFWKDTYFPDILSCTCPDCKHYAEARQVRIGLDKMWIDHEWEGGIWAGDEPLRCDYCFRLLRHYV